MNNRRDYDWKKDRLEAVPTYIPAPILQLFRRGLELYADNLREILSVLDKAPDPGEEDRVEIQLELEEVESIISHLSEKVEVRDDLRRGSRRLTKAVVLLAAHEMLEKGKQEAARRPEMAKTLSATFEERYQAALAEMETGSFKDLEPAPLLVEVPCAPKREIGF